MTIAPMFDDRGRISHFIAVKDEISERIRLEQELRRFHLAVEQASDGILLADIKGKIEYCNPAWARLHGYKPEELQRRGHIYQFHSREQIENELKYYCRHLRQHG